MTPVETVTQHARRLGFALVGIARPDEVQTFGQFEDWLAAGNAGTMAYLSWRREERRDARRVWPKTRSVVMLALPYRAAVSRPEPAPPNAGIVSSYAWGGDYHDWCRSRLDELLAALRGEFGEHVEGRGYVDTGPILERDFGQRAGLGWFGKNTMLIHPAIGSWFFIAELLLSVDLPATPEGGRVPDRCGRCNRCLVACPTNAFVGPYLLDARRCISYLTIEHKGSIPRDLRSLMGAHVFGCDICQEVCPWNLKAERAGRGLSELPVFQPKDDLLAPDLVRLLRLTDEGFRRRFAGSPVLRARRRGFLRNVCVALGNVGNDEAIPPLVEALRDPAPLVREHAGWALARLAAREAAAPLGQAIERETDEATRADLLLSRDELGKRLPTPRTPGVS